MFLLGLLAGGLMLRLFYPASLENTLGYSWVRVAIAGLLVGYGTVLGNGCTSGHGVCGISRFSLRSIFATLTFMVFGMMAVWLGKFWG
ncbi:MAG: YeeE/YedE thiosulfate transporter family protein [Bdellovibrionota bacterium]